MLIIGGDNLEYTIKSLANLAGVSTRTLRYYDEIGLLSPCRVNSSGYRIYGEKEVNLLQQILFYRELELSLDKIKEIITKSDFNYRAALYEHKENLLKKQEQLKILLNNVEKTISSLEGESKMSNKEKFEGFKEELIKENEKKYGKEIREKYGEDVVTESYKKITNLSEEQWAAVEGLSKELNEALKEAMKSGDPSSELAQKAVELHKKWLSYFSNYPKEAHLGLGQMYVDDPRFTEYYEKNVGENAAVFLRDAIGVFYNAKFDEESYGWIFE